MDVHSWKTPVVNFAHGVRLFLPDLFQGRIPFMVAERVPWDKMCETLNQKFMAEVQTTKGLFKEHFYFLAQKIFGNSPGDLRELSVSWAQFNKVSVVCLVRRAK